MFRKTSAQSSLFDLHLLIPDLFPKDDWCYIYRDKIYPLIDEDTFRHLFSDVDGAPNKSVKIFVSLLIFMGMEKLGWREVPVMLHRRIDWQIAVCVGPGEFRFEFTTLFKFYQRLEKDDTAYDFFQELVNTFTELCGTSVKKQRTDTFFIHGWLKILSRYGLLKETIRVFLQNLRKQKVGLYDQIKGELSREYLEKDFDLTEKDKDKAHRQIKKMARDIYRLKTAFENHKNVQHYQSFKTLVTVFEQQCEVVESTENKPEILIREKPLGDHIICTPHNTDAQYTRKGDQKITGHKGLVSETCDTNNKTQFITDVNVVDATKADADELPESQKRREDAGLKPEHELTDAAFNNGQTILDAQDMGIGLHGPTAGRSQSPDTFTDPQRPLDAADFKIDLDAESRELTVKSCPKGDRPTDQEYREKAGHQLAHFDQEKCAGCELKDRCPTKVQKRTATLTLTAEDVVGARQHRRFMTDPQYRQDYKPRAGAEATVSEMTRAHGMRKSRHRRQDRTKLQMIFAAIACNVKRFIRHGQNHGFECPEIA